MALPRKASLTFSPAGLKASLAPPELPSCREAAWSAEPEAPELLMVAALLTASRPGRAAGLATVNVGWSGSLPGPLAAQ